METIKLTTPLNQQSIRLTESETDLTFALKSMQTNESYKLLGVHVPLTGTMQEHYQHLMEKCNTLCSAFNQLSLTPATILLAIQTIANPALPYSLPATTIDEKYLNHCQ
jgi:hypothetical protein